MGQLLWVGAAIGVLTNALSLVKLALHFFDVGIGGMPAFVVAAYAQFVLDIRHLLIEVPFHIRPPEWAMHAAIAWSLFTGSNHRFLNFGPHGRRMIEGLGDVGRGESRPFSEPVWRLVSLLLAATGPLFALLVFIVWLGNRQMGPTGLGHWGDRLMIANRVYTLRISRIYLAILALAPVCAALVLAWGAAGNLPG
jgi:hypothetical protein